MVIDDLDVGRAFWRPHETDVPPVIDPNAVRALSIELQCLTVSRPHLQIFKNGRPVKLRKFAKRRSLDIGPTPRVNRVNRSLGSVILRRWMAVPRNFGLVFPLSRE